MMNGHERSGSVIVAAKPANKAAHPAVEQSTLGPAAAELGEPRTEAEGNADQQSTCRAQNRISVAQASWGSQGRRRRFVRRLRSCRVGRGGAYALPLPARSNGSCSFPASRFPMWTPLWRRGRIDAGREIDQPHKSELLHQPWKWILSPHRVSPFLGDERT